MHMYMCMDIYVYIYIYCSQLCEVGGGIGIQACVERTPSRHVYCSPYTNSIYYILLYILIQEVIKECIS